MNVRAMGSELAQSEPFSKGRAPFLRKFGPGRVDTIRKESDSTIRRVFKKTMRGPADLPRPYLQGLDCHRILTRLKHRQPRERTRGVAVKARSRVKIEFVGNSQHARGRGSHVRMACLGGDPAIRSSGSLLREEPIPQNGGTRKKGAAPMRRL